MFCPNCGTHNEASASYCVKCGSRMPADPLATPAAIAPASAALAVGVGPIYAGFWKRFVAYVLDWIVLYFAFFIATLVAGLVSREGLVTDLVEAHARGWMIFQLVVVWLYYALTESSPRQATFGKMALGIKVVDLAGRRISFLRATGRFFGQIVSSMIFCIGYLMAGFTARKQALHDIMAGCLVVNRGVSWSAGSYAGSTGSSTGSSAYAASSASPVAPRRGMSRTLIAVIVVIALIPLTGLVASVAIPAYQDYTVRAKLSEVAALGNAATRAVNDYYAAHQALPDDLRAAGFSGDGRYVESIAFDRRSRTVVLTANFAPLEGRRLLYVASSPGDAPRIVWRCTSDGIPNRYLPASCRSVTTRL